MSLAPNDGFETADAGGHSYFVPMVDMLAGVVFILVILLAAVSLVSRQEFSSASEMQAETKRIQKELQAAREAESHYLDPRRQTREALRLLLDRLHAALADEGVASKMLLDEGRLRIRLDAGYAASGLTLSQQGERVADILARALGAQLPCLAGESARGVDCGAYPKVTLDNVGIALGDSDTLPPAPQGARALSLLSRMVIAEPRLLELRAAQGAGLVDYRQAAPPPEPEGAVKRTEGQADIDIKFEFLLPRIPG